MPKIVQYARLKNMINKHQFNRIFLVFLAVVAVLSSILSSSASRFIFRIANAESNISAEVSISDLGIVNTGALPTSPFYFFKEWGRNFRRAITFNPVKRAELELGIVNAKVAELKKIQEIEPENAEAIKNALENYNESQDILKNRFETLKETSENPNVDKLIDDFADKAIKHGKIFDNIAGIFKNQTEIQNAINATKEKIESTAGKASEKDEPAKFVARIEKALLSSAKGDFEKIRSIETIDGLNTYVSEETKKSLERLRGDFASQLQKEMQIFVTEQGVAKTEQTLQAVPGDLARRSVILEEMKFGASVSVQKIINKSSASFLEDSANLENKDMFRERAQEQIRFAEMAIQKLESRSQTDSFSDSINALAKNARDNFEKAKQSLSEEKWGEAFGQARSAEALTRNTFTIMEKESISPDDLKQILNELEARMTKYANFMADKSITADMQPKAYEFLANTKQYLEFARTAFTKGDIDGTKSHIGHVKDFLQDLGNFLEWFGRGEGYEKTYTIPKMMEAKPINTIIGNNAVCIQVYEPICGTDNKTYSNECVANNAGVKTQYKGECKEISFICPDFARPNQEMIEDCKMKGGNWMSPRGEAENGCRLPPTCVMPDDKIIDLKTAPTEINLTEPTSSIEKRP